MASRKSKKCIEQKVEEVELTEAVEPAKGLGKQLIEGFNGLVNFVFERLGFVFVVLGIFGFYTAMIAIGIYYEDSCPAQPYLPYVVVLFGVVEVLRNICVALKKPRIIYQILDILMRTVLVLETFLVYLVYPANYDDERSVHYCNVYFYRILVCQVLGYICAFVLAVFKSLTTPDTLP